MTRVSHTGYALVVNVKYFEDQDNNREDSVSDQLTAVTAFKQLGFETKLVTEELTESSEIYVTIDHFKREFGKGNVN